MSRRQSSSGFTLLELSFVIVIIAIITAMGLSATLGSIETAKRAATQKKLDVIEKALQAFVVRNNRLPCPSDLTATSSSSTYNQESQNIGTCSGTPAAQSIGTWSVRGGVPVKTLGLPDSFMFDSWDRKLVYSVDRNTTYDNAFDIIDNDESCELEVADAAGTYLTGQAIDPAYSSFAGPFISGAAYVLLSYGENGHGAYTQTGVKFSSGSADASELQNCRCDSTGADVGGSNPKFVQQDESPTFDDIVRFKEPWQIQAKSTAPYVGPDLAVSIDRALPYTGGMVTLYSIQCGRWQFSPGGFFGSGDSLGPFYGVNFFANNSKIFMAYRNNLGSSQCYVSNSAKGEFSTPGAIGITCPSYTAGPPTNQASASRNGYVAISSNVHTSRVVISKVSGNYGIGFTDTPVTVLSPVPASIPTKILMSRTGKYLALTRTLATTYTSIYVRTGDRIYTKLTDPAPATIASAMAFSNDERYVAMAENGSATVRVWSINPLTNVFTQHSASPITGPINPTTTLNFSPDGNYLGMAGGAPVNLANYSTKIALYKFSATAATNITPTGAFSYDGTAFVDLAFSPGSHYMVVPFTSNLEPIAVTFRRRDANTFVYHSDIYNQSGYALLHDPVKIDFRE